MLHLFGEPLEYRRLWKKSKKTQLIWYQDCQEPDMNIISFLNYKKSTFRPHSDLQDYIWQRKCQARHLVPVGWPPGSSWLTPWFQLVDPLVPVCWPPGSSWLTPWFQLADPQVPVGWPLGSSWLTPWFQLVDPLVTVGWPNKNHYNQTSSILS